MKTSALFYILTGVVLNSAAQLLLKTGTNRLGIIDLSTGNLFLTLIQIASQWPIILGALCYGISFIVWIIGLSRVDVSIAYPMLSIGYIINAVGAHYWLGENLSIQRMVATGIILLGVLLLVKS
jgi:multidrug transporter EmrE-like cation transporter